MRSKIGQWTVYKNGDMVHESGYDIPAYRLHDEYLVQHMIEKNWVSLGSFIPAYRKALSNAGLNDVDVNKMVTELY